MWHVASVDIKHYLPLGPLLSGGTSCCDRLPGAVSISISPPHSMSNFTGAGLVVFQETLRNSYIQHLCFHHRYPVLFLHKSRTYSQSGFVHPFDPFARFNTGPLVAKLKAEWHTKAKYYLSNVLIKKSINHNPKYLFLSIFQTLQRGRQ